MDILITQENVNVTDSVIVSGLTDTDIDQELEQHLVTYGSVNRTLLIDDTTSKFHRHTIVEFSNSTAMHTLRPLLPMEYTSPTDAGVTFKVRALDSVYTHETDPPTTQSYLAELKVLALKSGKDFTTVLKELMSEISEVVKVTETQETPVVSEELVKNLPTVVQPSPLSLRRNLFEIPRTVLTGSLSDSAQKTPVSVGSPLKVSACPDTTCSPVMSVLSTDVVTPPEVQKLVVEHIIRGGENATRAHSSLKLRTFSGKIPRPNNESDYDTWRSHVELILKDTSMPDLQKSFRIRESILPPASDVVKRLGPEAQAASYIQLLDAAYDTVEDGDELMAKFTNTFQDSGEKTSTYLHRLQAVLNQAVRREGVAANEADRHLIKQLCRGCWDTALLLKLEPLKDTPPSFTDLLLLLRGEEDKEASRAMRMKQHLGSARPRAATCAQSTLMWEEESGVACLQQQMDDLQGQLTRFSTLTSSPQEKGPPNPPKTNKKPSHPKSQPVETRVNTNSVVAPEIGEMWKQIAELQAQMARQTAELQARMATQTPNRQSENRTPSTQTKVHAVTADSDTREQPRYSGIRPNRPRAWYCFTCGEDAHIATNCQNAPNPPLAEEKKRKLREAQARWDQQNTPTDTSGLN